MKTEGTRQEISLNLLKLIIQQEITAFIVHKTSCDLSLGSIICNSRY